MSETGGSGARLTAQALAVRRGERLVLSALDLSLISGDALLLTGANGAGKTTLLRALAGLLPREGGTLALFGHDPREDLSAYAEKLHFLGHRDGVKTALSVRENLTFYSALMGGAPDPMSALEALGIAGLAELPAAYLSAGQKRRLALARLLLAPRPLWLLDEPAASLDADGRAQLLGLIARHRAQGGMVVLSSHGELAPDGAHRLELSGASP